MFAEAAERVFASAAADPQGGFDAPLWTLIEEGGFDRLLLPEEEGGAGDSFDAAAAVLVRLGASAAAVPLAEALVANWCLAKAGLDVPAGPKAFVSAPPSAGLSLNAAGRVTWPGRMDVCWLPVATHVVAVAPDARGAMQVAIARAPRDGGAGETLAGEPVLSAAAPAEGVATLARSAFPGDAGLPLALAGLLKAAAIAGAMSPVVDMSVEYANTRRQFGRAIGGFQAVQHMLARMASDAAAAGAAVQFASRGEADGLPWRAAIAKARTSEAAGLVAALAHQVHGAIGFTREYALHRYTRRLWAWREEYGNEAHWNGRIGRSVIESEDELWPSMTNGLRV